MKKQSIILFQILLVSVILSDRALAQQIDKAQLAKGVLNTIDSICTGHRELFHYPGLAIAVYQKNGSLWTKGYGYADIENKIPIDPNEHLFRIGSISKVVTGCALARMIEKKQIDLDAPIIKYIPSLPADKDSLTLRQLANHTSGIRHYKGLEFFSNIQYTDALDPLDVFINDTLEFDPGYQYGYSTYGFTLISAVMEQALHIPFIDIVRTEVSVPLDLRDLKADVIDAASYRRVGFYDYRDSVLVPSIQVNNSNKWAGGGFLCAADDLARFGMAIADPGYLKAETLDLMTSNSIAENGKTIHYGVGIRTGKDVKGRSWYGHSGGSVGGTSMLLIYPEEDLVVVTLVNLSSADMQDLAWKIADVVLEQTED